MSFVQAVKQAQPKHIGLAVLVHGCALEGNDHVTFTNRQTNFADAAETDVWEHIFQHVYFKVLRENLEFCEEKPEF